MYLKVYPRLHIFLDEYDMEVMKITCESHVNHMGDCENHTLIIGDMKITGESHGNYENHM